MSEFKPLPIGIENFKELVDKGYYFIDKTLMIKDLLDSMGKVSLFTRPRRFGKTLNMSMLRRFFEKTDEDNSYLFNGLNISKCGEKYMTHQGQYPVIKLSLKSMKQPNFEYAFNIFKSIIREEFDRHSDILTSDRLSAAKRESFEKIYYNKHDDLAYPTAIYTLSDCLSSVYNKDVIILIDEYDVPLENAYFEGFYNDMIKLIRSVFESALKTNDHLEFAVLTGCLRISRESIFTGLNNLKVFSITDNDFSQYFGFTEPEVEELVNYYGISKNMPEMKEWYNGYIFGKTEIYNPWSVLNYISSVKADNIISAEAYWANTSSNSIIHELIVSGDKQVYSDIEKLIKDGSIDKPLYQDITYADINVRSDCIWSFLLHTGYLKSTEIYKNGIRTYFKGTVPNLEVVTVYEDTFRQWFNESVRQADRSTLFNAVIKGEPKTFELEVNKLLAKSISYHDGYENFYHGFLTGLLQYSDEYVVESNRESGNGRSDIIVRDVYRYKKAVIIEIKSVNPDKNGTLSGQCDKALEQIEQKKYYSNLVCEGYTDFIKYGIAFKEKRCMVKMM